MDKQGPEKKQTGRVNYIMVLAGGYLLYTAYQLFRGLKATEHILLSVCGGVVFAAFGGWLIWREWKAYQYGLKHIDDPESWSDDDPEELPEELPSDEDREEQE